MRFKETKIELINLFKEVDIKDWIEKKVFHKKRILVKELSNKTKIYISFIGYKTKVVNNKIIYDYRVDIEKNELSTSLSHTNIILDIYNKVLNGKMNHKVFMKYLGGSSFENDFELDTLNKNCLYRPVNPTKNIIDTFTEIHEKLNKSFNKSGNKYDLTFEELFNSILYISIQEDINYPINEGFEGRKMCFLRYVETLYLFENSNKSLEDVISRSLSYKRPKKWKELKHSFLKNIYSLI